MPQVDASLHLKCGQRRYITRQSALQLRTISYVELSEKRESCPFFIFVSIRNPFLQIGHLFKTQNFKGWKRLHQGCATSKKLGTNNHDSNKCCD
uniref:Uncharacterized protein n=1 Tax=Rhizophora mucronata TaxID=61149 RepID=A0A2P2QSC4_RHIMU